MKKSSYMTRAMQARDPRFATILGKLGYDRADFQPSPERIEAQELDATRAQYHHRLGKRPFHGWDVATLKAKIAEASA